jgi:hypothetical protein
LLRHADQLDALEPEKRQQHLREIEQAATEPIQSVHHDNLDLALLYELHQGTQSRTLKVSGALTVVCIRRSSQDPSHASPAGHVLFASLDLRRQ